MFGDFLWLKEEKEMLATLKCEKLKQAPRKLKPKRPPAFEKSTSGKF